MRAHAVDGVIEAIECMEEGFILGVQWHHEMMASHDDQSMLKLFESFITICQKGSDNDEQ